MKLSLPFLSVALSVLAPQCLTALADQGSTILSPTNSWKTGESWTISVELYFYNPVPETPPVVERFPMRVLIAGNGQAASGFAWKVDFVGGMGAPTSVKEPYRVWVDRATGWPRKINRVSDGAPASVVAFGDARMTTDAPAGFPLEVFALTGPADISAELDGSLLRVTREMEGENLTLEARLTAGKLEKLLIRQKWVKGEKWWRQYERYVNGKLDMVARREVIEPSKKLPNEIRKEATVAGKDRYHLWSDVRLQKDTPLVAINPKRAALMKIVEEASGLKLSVAPNLESDDPLFGDIQYSKAKAYMLMDLMANQRFINNGRWVRVGAVGYRLEGEAKPPVDQPADADNRASTAEPGPKTRRWLTVLTVSGIVLVTLGIVFWRVRASRSKSKECGVI